MTSSFGNHFILATFMLSPSSDNDSDGSWFERVICFNTKPPMLRTTSNLSAFLMLLSYIDNQMYNHQHIYRFWQSHWLWDILPMTI